MAQNLKKQKQTKDRLKSAFMRVYSKKNYGNITINEICKEAGLYRATFYNYYSNIWEILNEVEDQMLKELALHSGNFKKFRLQILNKNSKYITTLYRSICTILYDNRDWMLVLYSPTSNPSFRMKMKRQIVMDYLDTLSANHIVLTKKNEVILNALATSVIESQYLWLKDDTLSIEEIAELLCIINKKMLQAIEADSYI